LHSLAIRKARLRQEFSKIEQKQIFLSNSDLKHPSTMGWLPHRAEAGSHSRWTGEWF